MGGLQGIFLFPFYTFYSLQIAYGEYIVTFVSRKQIYTSKKSSNPHAGRPQVSREIATQISINFPSTSAATKLAHKPAERGFTLRLAVPSFVTVSISLFAISFHLKINVNYINDVSIPASYRKLNYYRLD